MTTESIINKIKNSRSLIITPTYKTKRTNTQHYNLTFTHIPYYTKNHYLLSSELILHDCTLPTMPIETKIKSLARRESQRYLNCVTSNLDRMTAVSERQINIILRLEENKLLSSLPEELEETARLRLRYPDLSLSALAAQMVPAITKSGLSHRLKKIEEMGAKLLKLGDPQ